MKPPAESVWMLVRQPSRGSNCRNSIDCFSNAHPSAQSDDPASMLANKVLPFSRILIFVPFPMETIID